MGLAFRRGALRPVMAMPLRNRECFLNGTKVMWQGGIGLFGSQVIRF